MNIDEVLTRGVAQVLPSKEELKKLMLTKKITLFQGFDPSAPSLHLGNFVGLMKLRAFQKLGHKVIFLVGDFTGMIGDPTDKLATRKQLTRQEVLDNCKVWKEQAGKIIAFNGDNPALVKFNSEWSDKINFKDLINITANFTVQQMIERDMFQNRLKKNEPIYLHEFLYPIAQGYDSVAMGVDLEIGGSDQIFNMLAGRTLMKAISQKEKFVLGTKLLVDKEGKKVGKTTGNALFLSETPANFYGGIMSFPDEVLTLGFELLTEVDMNSVVDEIKNKPMTAKKHLAHEIVSIIWGKVEADNAQLSFETTFQERTPEAFEEITKIGDLTDTMAQLTSVGSKSQARRLIQEGAVEINNHKAKIVTKIKSGDKIKIGKKTFIQIK